jgi:uncharacterized membrane protein
MDTSILALMEFFIVIAFVLGWAVLEIVGLRLDKAREREKEDEEKRRASAEAAPPRDAV